MAYHRYYSFNYIGRLFTLSLFLIVSINIFSQDRLKFSVADFDTDPFDFSAKDKRYEKKDGNGESYAIIKVTSTNPEDDLSEYNFNFGNLMHIVEEHDGVLWIYVQRNAKLVTITRSGYIPINKYDLHTTIESGKNYVMTLSSEQKKVYMQMVQFNVKPSDSHAVIMIKNNKEGAQEELFGALDSSGSVARNLEYGVYTYKILADNYHMAEGRFTLNNKNQTLIEDVTLRPNYSDMTFNVDADADIYVNGEKKGTRQWSGVLKAGNYQVECRQPNHKPSMQYVQVSDNDRRTIELKAPEPILGTVAVTSSPLGAEIFVDGVSQGQTPRNLELLIGAHSVEVTKDGYVSDRQSVEVEEDKVSELNFTLGKRISVLITSAPEDSKLYIDGAFKGNTPFDYDGEIGDHQVKLIHQGFKPMEKRVFIGKEDRLNFSLQKQLVKRNDIYLDAGVGIGSDMNITAAVGGHLANFNAEIYYSYSFSKSPMIYWNMRPEYTLSDGISPGCEYSPSFILGAKAGYGIPVAARFKFSPQVGYRFTKLSETIYSGYNNDRMIKGAYCSGMTVGVRCYCAIIPNFGVSITPEYTIGIAKSEGFRLLSSVSSKIKNMGEGFNARIALVLTF